LSLKKYFSVCAPAALEFQVALLPSQQRTIQTKDGNCLPTAELASSPQVKVTTHGLDTSSTGVEKWIAEAFLPT